MKSNDATKQVNGAELGELVQLGKIVGVWGVKGWLKLHSYTRNRIEIGDYARWFLSPSRNKKGQFTAYEVTNCRTQGQGLVAQLAAVESRDQAQVLTGHNIFVPVSDLPELPENQYYWQQLVGLNVHNQEQEKLGQIESLLETGANDVLVLKREKFKSEQEEPAKENGNKQVLIPYTPEVVLEVDLEQGVMIVDWDPSFLD